MGFLLFFWTSGLLSLEYWRHEAADEVDEYDPDNPFEENEDEYHDAVTGGDFYDRLLDLDSSFSGLLNFFSLVFLAGFFGVSYTVFLYLCLVFVFYVYLALNKGFVGRSMTSVTQLDGFDPHPGFFSEGESPLSSSSPFCDLDNISLLVAGKHSVISSRFGLFSPLETLLHTDTVNPILLESYSDPYFFSKVNYYYVQFYIFSAVNEFWASFSDKATAPWRPELPSTNNYFYPPSRFFPYSSFSVDAKPHLSCFTFISREALLRRIAQREYILSFSTLLFTGLDDQLSVFTGPFERSFPVYRAWPSLCRLAYILISRFIVGLTPIYVSLCSGEGLGGFNLSSFSKDVVNSLEPCFFRSFPPSYFHRWASLFFSYRLSYVPFRFKDSLLPDDWSSSSLLRLWALNSSRPFVRRLLSTCSSIPARRAGSLIFEFLVSRQSYPVSLGGKYYFLKGYLFQYTSESLRLIRSVHNNYLFRLLHERFLDYKFRKSKFISGYYFSFDRVRFDSFFLRKWVGRTGDGLEPFFSPSARFDAACLSGLRGNLAFPRAGRVDSSLKFPFERFLNVFTTPRDLVSHNWKPLLLLVSEDPRWASLSQLLSSFRPLGTYLKNLAYNPESSEFFSSFLSEYGSDPLLPLYRVSLSAFSDVLPLKIPLTSTVLEHCRESDGLFFPPATTLPRLIAKPGLKALKMLRSIRGRKPVRLPRNRFKREKVASTFLPYRGVQFASGVAVSGSLRNRLSVWGCANLLLYDSELLSTFSRRAIFKIALRDPFSFFSYSPRYNTKAVRFRRFFWESTFVNTIRSALFSLAPNKREGCFRLLLSRHLYYRLSPWFFSKFKFGSDFLMFLLSDLELYGQYFSSSYELRHSPSAYSWASLSLDLFSLDAWKSLFLSILAEVSFLSFVRSRAYSSSRRLSLFPLKLQVDPGFGLRTLLKVRNDLVLNLPNRVLARLAQRSSSYASELFRRKDWKLFAGTLSSLIYSLFSGLLGSAVPAMHFGSAFLSLLEAYSDSSKDYHYYTRFLFPTLDPSFKEYLYENNRFTLEEDNVLGFIERLGDNTNWWQTKPAEFGSEPLAAALLRAGSEAAFRRELLSSATFPSGPSFLAFLDGQWSLFSRMLCFSAFSFGSAIFTPFFAGSVSRLSFLLALPYGTDFFLNRFYQEFTVTTPFSTSEGSPFGPSDLAVFSFYEEGFPLDEDGEDVAGDFTTATNDFTDLDFEDEEDILELEEEGQADEEMEDVDRELTSSHPGIEGFDDMLEDDPLIMPLVQWRFLPGQAQPEYFHERLGFGSFDQLSHDLPGPFLIKYVPVPYLFFALYCLLKGAGLYARDPEYFQDFCRDYFFRESLEDIRKAKFIGFVD